MPIPFGAAPGLPVGRREGDHALGAAIGPGWGRWAQEIYADLGLRFDAGRAMGVGRATAGLLGVRQDAALLLHDQHASEDDVAAYLQRWGLMAERSARQSLRFVGSPLWRAYISTYVEGYRLLEEWLDAPATESHPGDRAARFRAVWQPEARNERHHS